MEETPAAKDPEEGVWSLQCWRPSCSVSRASLAPSKCLSSQGSWSGRSENWPSVLCSSKMKQDMKPNRTMLIQTGARTSPACVVCVHAVSPNSFSQERRREREREGRREKRKKENQQCPEAQLWLYTETEHSQIKYQFLVYFFSQQIFFKHLLCAKHWTKQRGALTSRSLSSGVGNR